MQSTCVAALGAPSEAALTHLVEAATALAKLQAPVVQPPVVATKLAPCPPQKVVQAIAKKPASSSPNIPRLPNKREIFPQRLLAILGDNTLSDVVAWLPHGRSFVIIRPDVFTEKVLPKYLPAVDARASTKYPSFTRKLNRWGFRQATRGPDTGAFHHPLFRRDEPELCLEMVCQRSRDRTKKATGAAAIKQSITTGTTTSEKLAAASVVAAAPLTKESLAAMSPPPCSKSEKKAAATVVSDDSASVMSASNTSDLSSPTAHHQRLPPPLLQAGVSNNKEFVEAALRHRDADERLKVAKAMLYDSYVRALRGE